MQNIILFPTSKRNNVVDSDQQAFAELRARLEVIRSSIQELSESFSNVVVTTKPPSKE